MKNNIASRIADQAQAFPDKIFFRFLDRGELETAALSFADVDEGARRVAAALLGRGIGGERILLVFEPGPDFILALVGCLYAGALAIPAPAPRRGASLERLEGIAAGSRAGFMLTSAALKELIGAQMRGASPLHGLEMLAIEALDPVASPVRLPGLELGAEEPVLIQYTSGSTLAPRGVVLDSACTLANIGFTCRGTGFGSAEGERFVNWMPHYHDMGLIGSIVLPLVMGFETVHMPPLSFVQSPARWLQAIGRYRARSSGGPPLAFDACVARVPEDLVETLDLSCWRIAFCGAEPVFRSTLEAFRDRFARAGLARSAVFSVYGLAEVTVYACGRPPRQEPRRAELSPTDRAPCFLNEETKAAIRIVSPHGVPLAQGDEGEIWISCPSVAAGYLEDSDATRLAFRNRIRPDDGRNYLRTGDLGRIEGDVLTVTGRIKDVLIRHGVNVAASDVERLATEGRPELNPNGAAAFQQEGPAAPIVLMLEKPRGAWNESREPELVRGIRKSVFDALGIGVEEIGFVEPGALPRTTSGKIQRTRARALWQQAGGTASSAPRRETADETSR